jgi:hypothetical protein
MFRWRFLGRVVFYQIEMKDTAGLAVIMYEASTSEASGPKGRHHQHPHRSTSDIGRSIASQLQLRAGVASVLQFQ